MQKQQSCTLSLISYKKIVFHCLRYPSSKVYGALIRDNTSSQSSITVVNAYPLFHSALVGPTLSLALDLIQSNLSNNQEICGFYEYSQQAAAGNNSQSVMSRIIQNNNQLKGTFVVKVWCKDGKFDFSYEQPLNTSSNSSSGTVNTPNFSELEQDLVQAKHRLIVDMDAHLDTIQLDFRNVYVK